MKNNENTKDTYFISHDGTTIHYIYKKNVRNCVVFLHGLGAGYLAWEPMYSYLYSKGHSVLSVDIRGHGYSDKPKGYDKYNLTNAAKDIELILQAEKLEHVTLLGHSYGTFLSIKCFELFPKKIAHVVLISSHFKPRHDYRFRWGAGAFLYMVYFLQFVYKKQHFRQIDFSKYRGRSDLDFPKIFNEIDNASTAVYIPYLKELLNFDGTELCKNIPSLLLIHGLSDICVTKDIPLYLHSLNKNSRLIYLRNINHHPPTNCPEILNEIIDKFLRTPQEFESWYGSDSTNRYKIV